MSRRRENDVKRIIDEAIINETLAFIEKISSDPVPSVRVKVSTLSVGETIVTNRRAGKTALVTKVEVLGDIRDCCNKWRNHRHITLNNGTAGCYWDESSLNLREKDMQRREAREMSRLVREGSVL